MKLPKRLEETAFLSVFLLLALGYLLPLPAHWETFIPGDNGDAVTNFWSFWYFPWALTRPSGFSFHSGMQFVPDGIDLIYTSCSPLGATLMAPVAICWSIAAALNTWLLLHLWLGGWFFFKMCRCLGAGRWAAWLAACAYGWSPFLAGHITGHYTLVQIGYTAGAMWALAALSHSSIKGEGRRATAAAGGLALACWGVAVTDFYLSVMTLFLLLFLLFHLLLTNNGLLRCPGFWKRLIFAGGATVLCLVPPVLLMIEARRGGDYSAINPGFGSRNVATWSRLVTLPAYHPIWGPRMYPEFVGRLSSFNEYTYIGMVSLALAFIGMLYISSWRKAAAWVVAFLLALGLSGQNRYSAEPAWPHGPLAFGKYWPEIFPLTEFRVPGRWQFALCTVVAVGVAIGADALLMRVSCGRKRGVIALVISSLLLFDLTRWPLPLMNAAVPDSGINPASGLSSVAVLDVPVGIISGQGHGLGDYRRETLLRQMGHGHPVLSANVSRLPNDAVARRKADPELTAWLAVQAGDEGSTSPDSMRTLEQLDWEQFKKRYHVGIVRIPEDWSTSSSLQKLANRMHPWHWRLVDGALLGE